MFQIELHLLTVGRQACKRLTPGRMFNHKRHMELKIDLTFKLSILLLCETIFCHPWLGARLQSWWRHPVSFVYRCNYESARSMKWKHYDTELFPASIRAPRSSVPLLSSLLVSSFSSLSSHITSHSSSLIISIHFDQQPWWTTQYWQRYRRCVSLGRA